VIILFSLDQDNERRGGKGASKPKTLKSVHESVKESTYQVNKDKPLPNLPKDVVQTIPVTYPHDEGLLFESKGCYIEDPMFQRILDSP